MLSCAAGAAAGCVMCRNARRVQKISAEMLTNDSRARLANCNLSRSLVIIRAQEAAAASLGSSSATHATKSLNARGQK